MDYLLKDIVRARIMAREDDFGRLFKTSSEVSSDHDAVTTEMVSWLHKSRDEQVITSRD